MRFCKMLPFYRKTWFIKLLIYGTHGVKIVLGALPVVIKELAMIFPTMCGLMQCDLQIGLKHFCPIEN